MRNERTIKKPLEFNTLYQRFLIDGKLIVSDEVVLEEYHFRKEIEPSINTFTREQNRVSVVSRAMDGSWEEEQDFFYSSHNDSIKSTLREALYAFSGLIVK